MIKSRPKRDLKGKRDTLRDIRKTSESIHRKGLGRNFFGHDSLSNPKPYSSPIDNDQRPNKNTKKLDNTSNPIIFNNFRKKNLLPCRNMKRFHVLPDFTHL